MKYSMLLVVLLSGCATQPFEWCKEMAPDADISKTTTSLRTAGCPTVASGYINQKHLGPLQTAVGLKAKKVQVVGGEVVR